MAHSEKESAYFPSHRKVFGWLTSHDPAEFFDLMRRPSIDVLPSQTAQQLYVQPMQVRIRLGIDQGEIVDCAIEQGIRDVSRVVRLMMANPANFDPIRRTICPDLLVPAVANAAGLPNDEIETYFTALNRQAKQRALRITDFLQNPYVVVDEEELLGGGCPFASYRQRYDPLFGRFVTWAGSLTEQAWRLHDLSTDR